MRRSIPPAPNRRTALAAGLVLAAGVLTARLLVAVPAGVPAATPPSAPARFAFAPAAGSYLQREIYTESARLGGIRQQIALGSEASVRISSEAGQVYILTRILRAAAARDGKPSDAAMVAAMSGGETVHFVRPDGGLTKIDGMRRLFERLLPTIAGEERAALERRLRENRIEDRARAAWFETTEILAGQTLELERDYYFDSAHPTDDGWIRHQTLLRLGPWEKSTYGRFLRLRLAYVADAQAEVPGAQRIEPKVATSFAPARPGKIATGFTFSGNASRLVDPATLTVWRDQTLRQVRTRVAVSEEMALTVSSEERSDVTLEPAPDPQPAIH